MYVSEITYSVVPIGWDVKPCFNVYLKWKLAISKNKPDCFKCQPFHETHLISNLLSLHLISYGADGAQLPDIKTMQGQCLSYTIVIRIDSIHLSNLF